MPAKAHKVGDHIRVSILRAAGAAMLLKKKPKFELSSGERAVVSFAPGPLE
jgi:hypothetical protein